MKKIGMSRPRVKISGVTRRTDWAQEKGECLIHNIRLETRVSVRYQNGGYRVHWSRVLKKGTLKEMWPELLPKDEVCEDLTKGQVLEKLKEILKDVMKLKVGIVNSKDEMVMKYPIQEEYGVCNSTHSEDEEDRRLLEKNIETLRGPLELIRQVIWNPSPSKK